MGDPLNGTVGAMPVKHSADIYIIKIIINGKTKTG